MPLTKIQTDSHVAVQLIEQQKALHLDSLKKMAEQVEGSFSFTVLDEQDNLYLVKGDNPLCVYCYPKTGLMLYASTEEILKKALYQLRLPLEKPERLALPCGDIARMDCSGELTKAAFDTGNLLHMWYLTNYQHYRLAGIGPPPRRYHDRQYKGSEISSGVFRIFPGGRGQPAG